MQVQPFVLKCIGINCKHFSVVLVREWKDHEFQHIWLVNDEGRWRQTQVRTIYHVRDTNNKSTFVIHTSLYYEYILTSRSANVFHILSLWGGSFKRTCWGRTKLRHFFTLSVKTLYFSSAWLRARNIPTTSLFL